MYSRHRQPRIRNARHHHGNATVVVMDAYLDHAATTPVRPQAREALSAWLDAANASSAHAAGQTARLAVETARDEVAAALSCSPHEVVFTSGGTEANNLVIKGVVWAARDRSRRQPHVVTSGVEHPAVLETVRWLADRGDATVTVVPPAPDGRVEVERVVDAVREDTVLVTVMAANNELGAINEVPALAAALAERDVVVHSDAVQAMATLPVELDAWGVDALSLSAHKFGGPQGVGVAVLRRGIPVEPLTHGGGQDRGVRSGTFATGLIAACGSAMSAAVADRKTLVPRLQHLADRLTEAVTSLDGVRRDGPTDPAHRLVSHVHLSLDDIESDALTLGLDGAGVAASAGSACGSGAARPSHVVAAAGLTGTPLRLSLGWTTTDAEVDHAIEVLTTLVPRLRAREGSHTLSLAPMTRQEA